jgi:hypothetical protein
MDVGGALDSLTGLKSLAEMVCANGSLVLVAKEDTPTEITVTTQRA